MSRAIVGRIIWKEIRVQRAFWFWILLLGAFIQFVPRLLGRDWYSSALSSQWFLSVNLVVSCCFAVGSAAIAFAGETEGRTKSLFQRMPLQTVDLLVGKVSWLLLGTYTLFLLLTLSGALQGDGRTTFWSNDAGPRLDLAQTWVMPLPFLVVGVLCSLVLRDVLTTVAVAGIATTVLLGSLSGQYWFVLLSCFAALAVVDVLLAPTWLRDASIAPWQTWLGRSGSATASRGHSTFSVRSQSAWRRTASSLIWKEWHQAIGLTLTLVLGGAIVISVVGYFVWRGDRSFEMGVASLLPGLLLALPLVFGVAAAHSDRRDGAFRLLAHRGVSPNAYWLTKHAVWLGLALATCGGLLGWEHAMSVSFPSAGSHRLPPLWDMARSAAVSTFEHNDSSTPAILGVVIFDVVLLYSIGALCAAIIPSTLSALVVAIIGWLGLCFYWTGAAWLGLASWWSLGILPLIFLFAAWVRTRDWLVDRNSLAAWGGVALSLIVPLSVIAATIVVYRVVQIPPVTLPLEVQQSVPPTTVAAHPPKQSLFVDAMAVLTPRPPASDMSVRLTAADGWKYADDATRDFVAANGPARRLALEAVQQPPGDFPAEAWRGIVPNNDRGVAEYRNDRGFAEYRDRLADLAALLRDSARKLESENKLAGALDNYIAIARLGDDLARSNRVPLPFPAPDTAMMAMSAMDRWAAHPQQTAELIKRAISEFQRFEQAADFGSSRILVAWRAERQVFEDYVWKGQNPNPQTRTAAEMGFVRWCLPWELVRLQRVENAVYTRVFDETQLVERELHNRGFVNAGLVSAGQRGVPWTWLNTTFPPPEEAVDGVFWRDNGERIVNRASLARLHFLASALAGYRREHQRLPERLSALVPAYFAWLPVDPWTGSDFLYEPQGIPARLDTPFGDHLQPLQPFVASAGAQGARIERQRTAEGRVQVFILVRGEQTPAKVALTAPLDLSSHVVPLPDGAQQPTAAPNTNETSPQKRPPHNRPTEKAKPAPKPAGFALPGQTPPEKPTVKPPNKVAPSK